MPNILMKIPDLYTRLQPVMNLIKIIFYKTYKKGMENYNDIMASGLNKEKIRKKTSSKNLNKIDENKIIEDNNLFLFFYLLSYNISPCLQKSMIELFDSLIKEISVIGTSLISNTLSKGIFSAEKNL